MAQIPHLYKDLTWRNLLHLPPMGEAANYLEKKDGLYLKAISLSDAGKFVNEHHRKLKAPQGGKFAVSVVNIHNSAFPIVGVAIVGRPNSRNLDDEWTAEVTRLAVIDGYPNVCSMLYGACWRASKAMGYRRIFTYTESQTELGTSLKASGWQIDNNDSGGGRSWSERDLITRRLPKVSKTRWIKTI